MNQHSILRASAIAALGLLITAAHAAAQTAKDLVGAWTLVTADAFGSNPKGVVIFSADGHMAAVLTRADLPRYASNNRGQGTAAEHKATVEGMISYFGRYSLNGKELTFHIDGSSFPNWIGADQKRTNVTLASDELRWTQPTPSAGGPPAEVVWRRAK
jgi:Lipocalin-like domain